VLGVARSGFYRWRRQPQGARQRQDAQLTRLIAAAFRQGRGNYGAPRIVRELRAQGTRISQRRCARLMRELGLKGRKRHARKPRTTDSRHGRPVPDNRLAQQPAPTGPDQQWVTDITYLRTLEGWLYLAVILDRWSRRVVGWACALTLHVGLALAALSRAIDQRRPPPGLLHHSDRGSQYVDDTYVQTLAAHGIERSMSRRGHCRDNAFAESFFSSFKTETGIEQLVPDTRRAAELIAFDYIETFYNSTRRHSSLDYLSPVAFETKQTSRNINQAA
jgi:putative transposase